MQYTVIFYGSKNENNDIFLRYAQNVNSGSLHITGSTDSSVGRAWDSSLQGYRFDHHPCIVQRSGLETRSLGLNTLGTTLSPSRSYVQGFLGLTSTEQGLNVTCSRPQRTATRPGLEPGTLGSKSLCHSTP